MLLGSVVLGVVVEDHLCEQVIVVSSTSQGDSVFRRSPSLYLSLYDVCSTNKVRVTSSVFRTPVKIAELSEQRQSNGLRSL